MIEVFSAYQSCEFVNVEFQLLFFWQEVIEKLSKGELPENEYSCINDSKTSQQKTWRTESQPVHSMRSRRTATWAKPRTSDDGYSRYFCKLYCYCHIQIYCYSFNNIA